MGELQFESQPKTAVWTSLGRTQYDIALGMQEERATKLLLGADNTQTVFCVEHPPTITIGRNGTYNHITATRARLEQVGMEVYEVDRGGDVTYHGPGQVVLYPILHLGPWKNDVGLYVRLLEQCVMDALLEVGIESGRVEGLPGVWVGQQKVCAIGARVRKRDDGEYVTTHGLALNVTTDLSHFDMIVPCGISDKGVTSIAKLLSRDVTFPEWELRLQQSFANIFEVSFI